MPDLPTEWTIPAKVKIILTFTKMILTFAGMAARICLVSICPVVGYVVPWDVFEALAKNDFAAVHIPEAYGGADAIATAGSRRGEGR